MWKTILEFRDGVPVKVEVDTGWVKLVRITETHRCIVLTLEGLADIADAVKQHLEIESAAEYINGSGPFEPEPLPLEDLEPILQAIAELEYHD